MNLNQTKSFVKDYLINDLKVNHFQIPNLEAISSTLSHRLCAMAASAFSEAKRKGFPVEITEAIVHEMLRTFLREEVSIFLAHTEPESLKN